MSESRFQQLKQNLARERRFTIMVPIEFLETVDPDHVHHSGSSSARLSEEQVEALSPTSDFRDAITQLASIAPDEWREEKANLDEGDYPEFGDEAPTFADAAVILDAPALSNDSLESELGGEDWLRLASAHYPVGNRTAMAWTIVLRLHDHLD